MKLSYLSETLIGSEIVKLGNEIKEKIRQGERIYNFTIGDFDPSIFPIPQELEEAIVDAYRKHFTNYPIAEGNPDLREAIQSFIKDTEGLSYGMDEILVASGGRPLIYALFRAICDAGDKVIYAVPSWNNNHYTHFVNGEHVVVEAGADTNFMPSAASIRPHIKGATMLALCSPQNPTGTILTEADMLAIQEMLRGTDVLLMSDEVYEHLIFDGEAHASVLRYPELYARSLAIYSFGKTYHNTGWKTGYCVAPPELTREFRKVHQFNVFSGNHPMQAAFADFMADPSEYIGLPDFYQQKRDFFLQAMANTRFKPLTCKGTYFQLFDYSGISDEPDLDFCKRITVEYGVAAIPVSAFYSDGRDDKVIRLCFAKTEDLLERAGKALEKL